MATLLPYAWGFANQAADRRWMGGLSLALTGALAPVLHTVTRPFLRPFQKVVPTVANVDLSPLIVLLIGQLLIAVPLVWLEKTVGRLL